MSSAALISEINDTSSLEAAELHESA